ncbi:MAG: lysylphosphatidylglycerol synthase domain-containing protein [Acidimicrobiales bacterium]
MSRLQRVVGAAGSEEVEARVRRPADLLVALGAVVAAGLLVLASHSIPGAMQDITRQVARTVRHLPRILVVVCAGLAALAVVGLLVTISFSLVRRRRLDGANALVSGGIAIAIGIALVTAWHAFRGGIAAAMLYRTDGSTLVRDAVIVALLTGSDTARYTGWGRYCTVSLTALLVTGLALDEITFFGVLVAALGGYAVGLLTRWSLRTTVRRPSIESLVSGLRRAGVDVVDLARPDPDSRELCGSLSDGRAIVLKAAGREVHGAGVIQRFWSIVRLRGAATGRQPISFRAALETEALASLMASNTGVLAPRVLLLAHFEPDTLVLARERLEGPGLTTEVRPAQVDELFRSLRKLHEIGVAHRDLSANNLVCETAGTGSVAFRSLESAVVGAGELVRRLDLAQLLTSVGSVLGAKVAVAAMRAGYQPSDEQAIAAILQPVALSSWGWSDMRAARGCLTEVRREMIGEGTTDIPDTRLERFRWRAVAALIALLVAAFVLVGQLSKVNLVGALSHADWTWFLVALVGSGFTYLGSSLNLVAFVPQRISVLKGALVELSGAFFGLVTPPTVGHLAVNGRFLHKQGVDGATTATAVGLSQLVNFITTVVLLVVAALLTGTGGGHLNIVPGPRLLAVLGGLIVLGGLLITVVPRTKLLFWHRVWPRIRGTWPQLLDVMSQPLRLIEGIGGNLLLTASYSLALIAGLHAVGAHPPIIATAAVFMAGNTVGAAAPTPGGIGAVEAVLVAGLTGVGIPAHDAVPGVLLFRVATFWLPIVPGWIAFLILQRRHIL